MRDVGPLLASGRDADIYAYGPDLVLRRSRRGRSLEREAAIMTYVSRHAYPAPRVEDVRADGTELVLQRVDGPTMLAAVRARPWTLRRHAATLADLHRRLHAIAAPAWLGPVVGDGARVVHLDLHPLNVIVSPDGPLVIDWSNAARGVGTVDVALTWLVMTCAEPGGGLVEAVLARSLRAAFVRAFLRHFDPVPVRRALPAVAAWKCRDPNMRPGEVAAIRRVAAREAADALRDPR